MAKVTEHQFAMKICNQNLSAESFCFQPNKTKPNPPERRLDLELYLSAERLRLQVLHGRRNRNEKTEVRAERSSGIRPRHAENREAASPDGSSEAKLQEFLQRAERDS